jgi:hypothetical protein
VEEEMDKTPVSVVTDVLDAHYLRDDWNDDGPCVSCPCGWRARRMSEFSQHLADVVVTAVTPVIEAEMRSGRDSDRLKAAQAILNEQIRTSKAESELRSLALRMGAYLNVYTPGVDPEPDDLLPVQMWEHMVEKVQTLRNERDAWKTETLHQQDRATEFKTQVDALREALEFYADPDTYHAFAFMAESPAGRFIEDFSFDHGDDFYQRDMPGKLARAALDALDTNGDDSDAK